MLCIIHDITEEVLLKKSWNFPPPTIHNRTAQSPRILPARRCAVVYRPWFCLLLIDIDHFKVLMIFTVIKGDEVLLVISRILETSVDREDKIYRWGRGVSALFYPIRRSPAR